MEKTKIDWGGEWGKGEGERGSEKIKEGLKKI